MTFLLSFGCPLLCHSLAHRSWVSTGSDKREPSALLYGYEDSNALIYDPYINGPFT